MTVTVGTHINQYKIIVRLGAGGMGEVYLAQDERLGRKVALKLLYGDIVEDNDWVRRFEQEARAASALNHPNIITIYEVGHSGSSHFISTEYIEGETLRQRLKRGVMTTGEVLDISIQTATALATAHKAGIIHRDIKPENIMLRPDGYVKVLDFGLAKFTEQSFSGPNASDPEAKTHSVIHTNPGAVMGTVNYMSPEQAHGSSIDERTDIFSLGIVMYEMLTGHMPFEGKTASDVIISIVTKKPVTIARYAPDTPVELERIVSKSLAKERDERYQTIKDLLIDLKRLKQRLEIQEELSDEQEQYSDRGLVSGGSGGGSSRSSSGAKAAATVEQRGSTNEVAIVRNTSSAEYIVNGIKQYKKAALVALATLVLALGAFLFYSYSRPVESIAVLPFSNINPDSNTEHLGDEITESIINNLSQLPGLRVVSFNSVLQYKGRQVDPQTVGRELNVEVVMIGRVTKRADSILISAELISAQDKSHIWGVQRPTRFSDLLLVPEEITAAVSTKIGIKLNETEKKKREAESLYVKGRNAWNKRTADGIREAIRFFEQAIQSDPNYAEAYAGMADCYNMLVIYGASAPSEAFPKARSAAEKALELDDKLAEGHTALAFIKFRGDWDADGAEREFKKAIKLNPNYAQAHQWYSIYLAAAGRFDEALEESRRTEEIDNTSLIIKAHYAYVSYFAHRFDDAIAQCRKLIELDPDFFVARRYLGLAYEQKGMHKEAVEEFRKAIEGSSGSALMKAEYAHALALSGQTSKAQAELDGLKEIAKQRYFSAYHIAAIYAALDDKDRAFEWLEKAYRDHADWMVFLNVDPRFDSLHSDPRFANLRRRINFK
ncbi:MAG TPA: protein kinase [Pyrinomonadaceae bacterium]|jgi:serine/threonine-protein kinase